jgi:adenylosuccinate lyase
LTLLNADQEVTRHLSKDELSENFNLDYHFQYVDTIFKRVFGRT